MLPDIGQKRSAEQRIINYMRFQSFILCFILIILIISSAFSIKEFRTVNSRIESIGKTVNELSVFDTTEITKAIMDLTALIKEKIEILDIDSINSTIISLKSVSDTLSQLDIDALNGAISALKSAADKLKGIDIDSINEAVSSLTDTAEKLKGIDVESLNNLIKAIEAVSEKLNSVSQKLETITNSISGIFKR